MVQYIVLICLFFPHSLSLFLNGMEQLVDVDSAWTLTLPSCWFSCYGRRSRRYGRRNSPRSCRRIRTSSSTKWWDSSSACCRWSTRWGILGTLVSIKGHISRKFVGSLARSRNFSGLIRITLISSHLFSEFLANSRKFSEFLANFRKFSEFLANSRKFSGVLATITVDLN